MDKNCNIVQDLIPLCAEKIASDESIEFVNEHCRTCETCKKIYDFSQVHLTKSEKEYDDKMQKIWKNIENQEKAKKRKKWIISSVCGFLVAVLVFAYISADFHGTIWAIGVDYSQASEASMKYFSQFSLYTPKQEDIDAAANALKEHFKENNKGEVLTDLIYNEYMTYNSNLNSPDLEKNIVFVGTIVEASDLPKLFVTNVSSTHKWNMAYITKTASWEVTSITDTVKVG